MTAYVLLATVWSLLLLVAFAPPPESPGLLSSAFDVELDTYQKTPQKASFLNQPNSV